VSALYKRAVSGVERIWLAYDQVLPHCIDFIIAGSGTLNADLWRIAIAKAAAVHPGIRSQYQGYLAWAKWIETDVVPAVREIHQQWPAQNYDDSVGILDTRLAFKNGCGVEVVIVHDKVEPKIVFRALHALVDGRGLLLFVDDCMRAYRGEALIGSASTQTDWQLAATITKKTEPIAEEIFTSPFPVQQHQPLGARWLRITLPLCDKPLPRVCMAFLASAQEQGMTQIRLALPVDLRRHLKNSSQHNDGLDDRRRISTGNLTGTIYLLLQVGDDIESITKKIRHQLDANEDCVFPKGYRFLSWLSLKTIYRHTLALFRRSHAKNLYASTAMISNVGRVSLAGYSIADFEPKWAAMHPPLQEGSPLFALMLGHDNGIEVILNFPLCVWHADTITNFSARLRREFEV
jgi:NRPS condensation-like uncharacterized protein